MDQNLNGTSPVYDYRQYDQIWQRVAPSLEPYSGNMPVSASPAVRKARQEESLPGAVANPCCMGSAAKEMVEVLAGFIEEAAADRRYYQAFSAQAPAWARPVLAQIARGKGEHVRTLLAVYYLINGSCYQTCISCERIYIGAWCPALRERYHAEACSGLNYIRAAEGTTDPCLGKLLKRLSADSYHYAEQLMALLGRSV